MKRIGITVAAASLLAVGIAHAEPFRAESRVYVTPRGDGTFSIPASTPYGSVGAWCAAADYAIDVLRVAGTTRLYVLQPQTLPSSDVIFGTSPRGVTPISTLTPSGGLRTPGANLSVDHAYQFCHDVRLRDRP